MLEMSSQGMTLSILDHTSISERGSKNRLVSLGCLGDSSCCLYQKMWAAEYVSGFAEKLATASSEQSHLSCEVNTTTAATAHVWRHLGTILQ